MVVVYRRTSFALEFLLLHRAHEGPDYEGDWAWTPPSGARQPGETVEDCAQRELYEEAGLRVQPLPAASETDDWAVFYAEVELDAPVTLHDEEHDRFEWVSFEEASTRCRPAKVAHGIECAARAIGLM